MSGADPDASAPGAPGPGSPEIPSWSLTYKATPQETLRVTSVGVEAAVEVLAAYSHSTQSADLPLCIRKTMDLK